MVKILSLVQNKTIEPDNLYQLNNLSCYFNGHRSQRQFTTVSTAFPVKNIVI